MNLDKETIEFVSNKTGMSFDEAKDVLTITDKELDIVINSSKDNPPKYQIEHDLHPEKIDVRKIADSLNLPVEQFSTWVEDDMNWILYGASIVDGIAGEGPTPRFATADFYKRWFQQRPKSFD